MNPEHLFLGTHTDNMRDMFAKGRRGNTTWKRYGKTAPSPETVAEMKRLRGDGRSLRSIARQFGTNHHTVKRLTEKGEQ